MLPTSRRLTESKTSKNENREYILTKTDQYVVTVCLLGAKPQLFRATGVTDGTVMD